ncbi:phenylalanine--tRNA ligase subunit beta [Pediococcus ethanolidurans]|uniref:Phenylalanine--tRNA ligase beta subunit n=1 Tax=Pediococcus ethanolidurans TaxID=319653 RepID=A0A0R2K8C4_9LACO|nr:phenylalanine--tRNA ligase subunit beta [Pediococcus ethanolidurans]KRN82493.1 phenylalanyl-tRNA synthetase beta subunit [Pediococcus ethanolidurans]GEN94303.1 phenylalanine--tRNA ligase beta subunit [Pediococcus ethanolidurans]SER13223.1 phenylalanyl-tRNA synthetase beta subunit [Pediococcus ethanolidurans]
MKVSYNWLKEYFDLDVDPKVLAEKIERTAVEVDEVTCAADGLKKIIVGYTLDVQPHPDSDHLNVCQVDVGEDEPIQIVCGAPNVAKGQYVIVAMHGARIKDNVKIKRSKMRGEQSNGMICALQEIGFEEKVVPKEYVNGIYVFPEDSHVKPGEPVYNYLGMDDNVIDTSVTPNRGDLFSMDGNAYEIGAIYDKVPVLHHRQLETVDQEIDIKDLLNIKIDAPEDVQAYQMGIVKHVKIEPSPFWLQVRLMTAGVRPINNVVDVTNYIMLKYGQPLHAFDYDKLTTKEIHVGYSPKQTKFVTLDGEERELRATDLMIKDGDKNIAMAGVMGGLETEISDQTKTVVIESAIFDPIKIRKTARYHVLHSEASMRFERGINPATVTDALNEALQLTAQFGQGEAVKDQLSPVDPNPQSVEVTLDLTRINHVLGTSLTVEEVTDILRRLQFTVQVSDEVFKVTVPARRWDIHIPADILEEIARIYGYDNLPSTLPTGSTTIGRLTTSQQVIRGIRELLQGSGLNQAMSYGLTTAEKAKMFMMQESEETKLDFPMSQDHAVLRMNLISGLLDDVAYNVARKEANVALYEQGRVFYRTADVDRPSEVEHLAGAITGSMVTKSWYDKEVPVDFYQLKGIVALLLHDLNLEESVSYVANQTRPEMHPGRTADIYLGDHVIGFIGQVHPQIEKQFKIPETYVFELDLQALLDAPKRIQHYEPISKYPAITRDVALLIDKEVSNTEIVAALKKKSNHHLEDIQLFDVYSGKHIPENKKSVAYTLTYRDKHNTLTEDEVNQEFEQAISELKSTFEVEIR